MLPDELLRPDLLCSGRSGLLRPGCSQLLRSGRLCADLRRSGRVLLPLVENSVYPGVGGSRCSIHRDPSNREREAESGGVLPSPGQVSHTPL